MLAKSCHRRWWRLGNGLGIDVGADCGRSLLDPPLLAEFRGHEHSVNKLKESSVNILTPYVISELQGDERLSEIVLQNVKGEESVHLAVDYLIVNYGFTSSLNLKNWGLDSTRQGIFVESTMQTSIPGVYACGDVALYDGKVKLIATGFGEAPTAVNNALHYIDPKTRTQPGHSSSLFGEE